MSHISGFSRLFSPPARTVRTHRLTTIECFWHYLCLNVTSHCASQPIGQNENEGFLLFPRGPRLGYSDRWTRSGRDGRGRETFYVPVRVLLRRRARNEFPDETPRFVFTAIITRMYDRNDVHTPPRYICPDKFWFVSITRARESSSRAHFSGELAGKRKRAGPAPRLKLLSNRSTAENWGRTAGNRRTCISCFRSKKKLYYYARPKQCSSVVSARVFLNGRKTRRNAFALCSIYVRSNIIQLFFCVGVFLQIICKILLKLC